MRTKDKNVIEKAQSIANGFFNMDSEVVYVDVPESSLEVTIHFKRIKAETVYGLHAFQIRQKALGISKENSRYIAIQESLTPHSRLVSIVVDKTKSKEASICECWDFDNAELIAKALNALNEINEDKT